MIYFESLDTTTLRSEKIKLSNHFYNNNYTDKKFYSHSGTECTNYIIDEHYWYKHDNGNQIIVTSYLLLKNTIFLV